ncbi:MAG: SDR family oxidoreductase [Ignavibacteriae bacterium]|nr:SDR family oxidoreductase [Ignavibacteriota bacterium]
MDKIFNGKIIWITGGSRGIGASIALRFADTNATIALSARTEKSFIGLKKELANSKNVFFFPCDVSNQDEVSETQKNINKKLGKIDILINNAGVAKFKSFDELSVEDYHSMINTNLFGTFITSKTVLPSMIKRKKGIILNIISVAAEKTFKGSSLYSASKAGVLAMSRSMREDLREKGIKVVDILPGATETELWSGNSRKKYGHRMMQPENLGEIIFNILKNSLSDNFMIEEVVVRPQLGDLS